MALTRRWQDADGEHIDVRGLAPPAPMVAILTLIDTLADAPGAAAPTIIAHLDRDPKMLYPELAERGWRGEIVAADGGEVRLALTRVP